MKRRVLLLGSIIGSYRSQYIIDYLSQRNYDFTFVYLSDQFLDSDGSKLQKLFSKVGRRLFGLIYLLFLPFATHVFMLPMNSRYDGVFKLAKRLGKKTIMDFYSSRLTLAESNYKIDQKPPSEKNAANLRNYDINVITNANKLIFLNESEADFYLEKLSLTENNVTYHISPLATPMRSRARLPGFCQFNSQFNICWWGKASQLHGLNIMFEAINLLKKKGLKFHLYLLETEKKRAYFLEEQLRAHELQDFASVRYDLSFTNGLEEFLVNHCDIALGSFGNTDMAKTVLINKAVDSISMGIPMITRKTSAIAEHSLDKDILFVCEPEPVAICNTIFQLTERKFLVDTYQQNALKLHKEIFSPSRFYRDLNQIFQ
jgi:hypothetical protein